MTKIKIKIPAQSLKVEIPEQEIEMDFQPIWEIDPPVIESEPIEPEPIEPPTEDIFDFDAFLEGKSGVVYLPDWMNNKEVVISSKGLIQVNDMVIVGRNTFLTFENWDVTPTQLFDLSDNKDLSIVGITFVTPPNRPICTGFPDKEVFGWERDTVKKGFFAYINGPKMEDEERVTFGLSRFVYSSDSNDRIYLIGQNLRHNGFNFTQAKNPYKGNLWLILKNIYLHNPIIEQPMSHYYSPTKVKVRILVQGGVAKIISDNTYSQIRTWYGYNNGSQRSILHFDRYVYDISDDRVIDDKTLILDENEYQAGDIFDGKLVVKKQIDESRNTNWIYSTEPTNEQPIKYVPDGEFDAYIIYKGNALFSDPGLTVNSKSGDWYITQSQGYGWSWYNQEFSGYIENLEGLGYFRNSTGSQRTQGLTIVNSSFEKNGPKSTANEPMPNEVKEYIDYLESL